MRYILYVLHTVHVLYSERIDYSIGDTAENRRSHSARKMSNTKHSHVCVNTACRITSSYLRNHARQNNSSMSRQYQE